MAKDYGVFGDVLAAAMIGSWKIEVDEGKEPRMYADATMRHLLGLAENTELTPEEVYHAWYDRVDPAHYDAVAEGVGYMADGKLAEIQYPWHHPDGRVIVVRCGGVRDRSYTEGSRVAGIHQWVTTMRHVDRELESQQRQLKESLNALEIDGRHEKLRADSLDFILKNDNLEEFVDFLSTRILELYGCDQVIYRDVEGRQMVKDRPGAPKLDFSLCAKCPHYEFDAPVYANGFTEMDDCRVGYNGIPVHPDCIVKASLTQQVNDGEKVFGYIALHYLDGVHHFTEKEKTTFDRVAKFMSVALARRRQRKAREAAHEHALKANRRNEALHKIIRSGAWSYLFDAERKVTKTVISPECRAVIQNDITSGAEWRALIHPADVDRMAKLFRAALDDASGKTPYDVEYRIRSRSGEYVWIRSAGRVLRYPDGSGEFYGICVDITDTVKRREEEKTQLQSMLAELREKNARFEVIKDLIKAGLWSFKLNAEDEVVAAEYSVDFAKFLNVDEALAKAGPSVWKTLVHPADCDATFAAFEATIADHAGRTPYDVVYRMADRNGKFNWYHSAGSVIRNEDGTGEFFGVQINITKSIEKEHEQQRQLEEARALEKANKAKSYFFSTVSHDIRTPLNAIIGYAELLKLGIADDAERRKAVDSVLMSGHTLLDLINDVLDLSKLEAGKMQILPEPVDPARLVEEVADAFRATIGGKPLEIRTEMGPLPWLKLDPQRVRQILFNLVGNAVKFTDEGYVAVKVEYVRGEGGRGTFQFAVSDTGCGISEEDQRRVALPYVQVGLEGSRGKGTGLGLAICKQLVARMGGEIELESALGAGTTFTVIIPDVEETDDARRARLSATQRIRVAVDDKVAANVRVLVVDDVMMNRMVLKTMLKKFGVEDVVMADSGFSALEKLKDAGPFDLVLTDMWMPGMDGERLVREIRQNPAWAKLPVYAVTADVEAQKAYMGMGFSGILLKPLTFEKLKEFFRTNMN